MHTHVCLHCGEPFTPPFPNPKQRFCSRKCWGAFARGKGIAGPKRKPPQERTCPGCGATFTVAQASDPKRYCTAACAYEHRPRARNGSWGWPRPADWYCKTHVCVECGTEYTATHPALKRCPACKNKVREPRTAKCDRCGNPFTTTVDSQRFCSDRCKRIAKNKRTKARRRDIFIEDVPIGYLIERDGGICQLCGKKVSAKPYPHPLSATVDHIVPVSLGGSHERANCQLAHLSCNKEKSNRLAGDQLLLIG